MVTGRLVDSYKNRSLANFKNYEIQVCRSMCCVSVSTIKACSCKISAIICPARLRNIFDIFSKKNQKFLENSERLLKIIKSEYADICVKKQSMFNEHCSIVHAKHVQLLG
jgi:hypothetical protein